MCTYVHSRAIATRAEFPAMQEGAVRQTVVDYAERAKYAAFPLEERIARKVDAGLCVAEDLHTLDELKAMAEEGIIDARLSRSRGSNGSTSADLRL